MHITGRAKWILTGALFGSLAIAAVIVIAGVIFITNLG